MRNLSLTVVALLVFGCNGSDITDDPQITLSDAGSADAAGNADAADPADADPNPADASSVDAAGPADAASARAEIFCGRYDTLCGYDELSMQRFDDEAACLAGFGSFDDAQQTCVEDQLDQLELDSDLSHCRSAMGRPPCN